MDATNTMIAEGLNPDDGSQLLPGMETPDGQTYDPSPDPVMTINGVPFGEPVEGD